MNGIRAALLSWWWWTHRRREGRVGDRAPLPRSATREAVGPEPGVHPDPPKRPTVKVFRGRSVVINAINPDGQRLVVADGPVDLLLEQGQWWLVDADTQSELVKAGTQGRVTMRDQLMDLHERRN